MGCMIFTETTLGPAFVRATGRSGTIIFVSRPGHQWLASTLNLKNSGYSRPDLKMVGVSEDGVRQGPGRHPINIYVPYWDLIMQWFLTWQLLLGCASGRSLALLKMAPGRRQTTKLASVPTTTPKPRAPLKGCSLSLLSLKHALAVGHLQPLRLGNSSRAPSLVALVSLSPF